MGDKVELQLAMPKLQPQVEMREPQPSRMPVPYIGPGRLEACLQAVGKRLDQALQPRVSAAVVPEPVTPEEKPRPQRSQNSQRSAARGRPADSNRFSYD